MISIEGYSDLSRIGQGGLGDVYRATRDSTGGTVAIKVLRDVSDESVVWHRTRRELTALVRLAGHGNVIQLLELLELPEGPALVMEYAPGGSVADMMDRRDETLSVGEVVFVGRHIATALVAAHAEGIVHRDVKPQNLLIDAYGQVKLCDFGIAAMARSDEFRTRTNAISMRYASPEDLDDEIDVGPASDVYSLGATLLHLARGAPPTLKERLAPWTAPPAADPDLAALDRIVAACLHPAPIERPTAARVVDELERLSWSLDERNRSLAPDVDSIDRRTSEPSDESPSGRADPAHPPATDDPPPPPRVERPPDPVEVGPTRSTPQPASTPTPALDETVMRPDRRPPPRPAPVRPSPGRPWGRISAAVVAIVAVAGGLLWSLQRDSDEVAESTLTAVERPGGLDEVTSVEWPLGPTGECLVQTAGSAQLDAIGCASPHDLQRIRAGELDAVLFPPDIPFDEDAVRAVVRDECDAAFEVVIGLAPAASEFDAPFSAPSASTWPDGDRRYQCFIGLADRRVVGDATGARR